MRPLFSPALTTVPRNPVLPLPASTIIRAGIVLTFVLIYPLRHFTYAPAWLVAEPAASGQKASWFVPVAEGLFLALLALAASRFRFPRRLWWLPLWIGLLAVLFGISTLVTAAAEGSRADWRTLAAAFRFHFRWVAPFFVGLLAMRAADARWLVRLTVGLTILNVPLAVLQYFAVRGRSYAGDYVTGTMGPFGGGPLMILHVLVISSCVVMYRARRMDFGRLLGLSSLLVVPIALGDSLFGFLLLPFALLTALGWWRVLLSRRTLKVVVLAAVLVALAAGVYSWAFRLPFTRRFTFDFLRRVTVGEFTMVGTGELRPGRLRILGMVHESVTAEPHNLLVGVGPGSGSLSTFAGSGAFAARHRAYIEAVLMLAGMVLLELGYLGVIWWAVLLLGIGWTLSTGARRLAGRHADEAWMVRSVFIAVAVLGVCTLYNFSYLATELMYPVWLLIGWALGHVSVIDRDEWRGRPCAS